MGLREERGPELDKLKLRWLESQGRDPASQRALYSHYYSTPPFKGAQSYTKRGPKVCDIPEVTVGERTLITFTESSTAFENNEEVPSSFAIPLCLLDRRLRELVMAITDRCGHFMEDRD